MNRNTFRIIAAGSIILAALFAFGWAFTDVTSYEYLLFWKWVIVEGVTAFAAIIVISFIIALIQERVKTIDE